MLGGLCARAASPYSLVLGADANDGAVIYLMVTHTHAHLGQSIAYVRMNGVRS